MTYMKLSRDEHFQLSGPKRVLALDGGGLRGILTLGFLGRMEKLLGDRYRVGKDFRLSHYFDLIAGTSTGAIIAAALATGMRVDDIVDQYKAMGHEVFNKSWFRKGIVRARYDEGKLIEQLQEVLGKDTTLGSDDLQTGLLVMTKRLDTGSPWPLGNNPRGTYFCAREEDEWISNAEYPLWQVVRASTAAPSYFDPEKITIHQVPDRKLAEGEFVDGGVSPFNNPALQTFMYATLDGFHVNWPTGAGNLLLVSVGTGSPEASQTPAKLAAEGAVKALLSVMDDCAALVETMMQWLSSSRTARPIDLEIGDLRHDLVASQPLLTYVRYDLDLTREAIEPLKAGLSDKKIRSLSAMDEPDNLNVLEELGQLAAEQQVQAEDFASQFDLHT